MQVNRVKITDRSIIFSDKIASVLSVKKNDEGWWVFYTSDDNLPISSRIVHWYIENEDFIPTISTTYLGTLFSETVAIHFFVSNAEDYIINKEAGD